MAFNYYDTPIVALTGFAPQIQKATRKPVVTGQSSFATFCTSIFFFEGPICATNPYKKIN